MSDSAALRFGPYRLLGRHGPLLRDGAEIRLQPKALALLWTLARQAGEVVTKSDLMDAVWPGVVVGEDALSFQVLALRKALEEDPKKPHYIATAHRIGFRFGEPVESIVPSAMASAPDDSREVLVGREIELGGLHTAFDKALQGRRQLVFVSGEAGIGKTALVDAFLLQLRHKHPAAMIGRGQCVEHQGPAEAYLPVLDALGHLLRQTADAQALDLFRRVAPSWLAQLPALMPAGEYAALRREAGGASGDRVLRELAEALELMSAQQPLVLVLEDLHWSDTATLDLLSLLAQRVQTARLLLLATVRPVDAIVSAHPVRAVQLQLKAGRRASDLVLGYLDASAVAQFLAQRIGSEAVSPALIQALHTRSGGNPLFLSQLCDYLLPPGQPPAMELAHLASAVPQGLRDLIALQLDQLADDEQQMLEAASVAGVDFAAASVAAATGVSADTVERACDRLSRQGRFIQDHGLAIWPDGTSSGRYRFRHVLHQQVLLQRPGPAQQARQHRQIADRLESAYGARTREVAGELAHHYEQAGVVDKTVRYFIALAGIALERAAQAEAIQQTERGLKWLESLLQGSARDECELALHTMALRAQQAQLGYHSPETAAHLGVVERLVPQVAHPAIVESALHTLWVSAHFQGRYDDALAHAATIGARGQSRNDALLQSCGHAWAAHSLHMTGRHREADEQALLGIQQSEAVLRQQPELQALDPGCAAQTARAITRWFLGFADQALTLAHAARAGAALIRNPYTECMILSAGVGNVLLFRRDWAELERQSTETIALSERYEHDDGRTLASQHRLIARCMQSADTEALSALLSLMDRERDAGGLNRNLIAGYTHAAEAALRLGDLALAQSALDSATALIDTHGPRPWEPEVWRVRGELLIAQDRDRAIDAEACLQRAIDLARARDARSLELRAALSLARLWRDHGRAADALALLQPLYETFTEGFDAPDLIAAGQLLDELKALQALCNSADRTESATPQSLR